MAKKGKVRFSKQQRWAADDLEDYLDERDDFEAARTFRREPRHVEPQDRARREQSRGARRVPEWGLS